jgi:uncharacterized protein
MRADGEPGRTREEVFIVPRRADEYFVYAPLRRSLAVVNEAAVGSLGRFLEKGGDLDGLDAKDRRLVEELLSRGLLGSDSPKPPVFPEGYGFLPHETTLFLTSRCNLRCRYCYADAGRKSIDMPWEVAQAAIDLVARNAGRAGLPKFGVGFHGGGEPTVAWDLLVRCVEHARQRAHELGLQADIFAATNGVLDLEQRDYVARHFTSVNVSLDGPPDIQNHNRRMLGGDDSYEEVAATLRHFARSGLHHGVRTTITSATVDRMVEVVEWFAREFRLSYLHMEPVWLCGRCTRTGERPPEDPAFASRFLEALERGEELGLQVLYSGARLDSLCSKFCAAAGDGFNVLPEGIATSCYEVTEADDPRAAMFHYGRYDSGSFVFDEERLARLRRFSVEHLDHCSDCFCRWHCAGDCLARVLDGSTSQVHAGSPRCELNRTLLRAHLERLVRIEGDAGAVAATQGASHDAQQTS